MAILRLATVAYDAAWQFRQASPSQRRKAALIACTLIATRAGLQGAEVEVALEHLRNGAARPVDPALLAKIDVLASRLDEEYLRLNLVRDEANEEEVLARFAKARAATAIRFALASDPDELHEALYEAIVAVPKDKRADIIDPVIEALET